MSEKGDEFYEPLYCSFCHRRLSRVIKLIPECGNSICGQCYEDLKKDADEKTKEYQCFCCKKKHILSTNGLPDNEQFLQLLKNAPTNRIWLMKTKNGFILYNHVRHIVAKLEKLQSFDYSEFELVRDYCEKIELEVSESIGRTIEHLEEIERGMMRQIREFRERCIQNLSSRSREQENGLKKELNALTKEMSEFNVKWRKYHMQIDTFEANSDIKAAIAQTSDYISEMDSMEERIERMKKEALDWEKLVFKENTQFLKEWNHVGKLEVIAEPKPGINQEESDASQNDANKKKTIQETPSFTQSGQFGWVRQLLFLPGGRLASCSQDNTIKLWNVKNGKELFQLRGHTDKVYSIALLPNDHLASCSKDCTIKIWDLKERKEILTRYGHSEPVASLRVLKNGNLASYSKDDTIKIWNLNSKENEPVATMRGHGNTNWVLQLFGILSNDYLVTCSRPSNNKEEYILRVWNPNEPNSIKLVSTSFNYVRSLLVLSNDQLALGSECGMIEIIDLIGKPWKKTNQAHSGWVTSLAQLSNGNLISAGHDTVFIISAKYTIKVWNLLDWCLLQTVSSVHSQVVSTLSISDDERFLASGSGDKTIKLWPISTEQHPRIGKSKR